MWIIGLLLFGTGEFLQTAQIPDDLYVIEATYVRVEQGSHLNLPRGTDRQVMEEGTYRIMLKDGRYRIDRTVQGKHTAEILNLATKTRIALNYESQQAVTGSMFGPRFGFSPGGLLSSPTLPMPDNFKLDESSITQMVGNRALIIGQEWLGTRFVNGIELVGVREVRPISGTGGGEITIDMWDYQFPNNPEWGSIVMEEHVTTPTWSMSKTLTDVTMTRVSASIFQIPRRFVTSTINPPGRQLIGGLRPGLPLGTLGTVASSLVLPPNQA